MDDDRRLRLFGLERGPDGNREAVALLAARSPACPNGSIMNRRPIGLHSISALTGFQTHSFGIIAAPDCDRATAWEMLVGHLTSLEPSPGIVDLACLGTDPDELARVMARFQLTRFTPCLYANFSRRYEITRGQSFDDYVASRPPTPRSLIKKQYMRKERKIEREFRAEFRVFTTGDDTPGARDAYDRVAAASWKPPERFPRFMSSLIELGLAEGFLRLFVLSLDDEPVATALVFIDGKNATIFRNDYDPNYSQYSVGAVSLCKTLRYLLDEEGIDRLDCGRDDEEYKRIWASGLETVHGIVAYDRATVTGARGLLQHRLEQLRSATKAGVLRVAGRLGFRAGK